MMKKLLLISVLLSVVAFADEHKECTKGDCVNGEGIETSFFGTHNGWFKDGKREGYGTTSGVDGSTYVGLYKDDLKHGLGTIIYADGMQYTGEFKEGNFNGEGILTVDKDQYKYTGEWKDGKRNGFGTLSINEYKYYGEFKDGKQTGFGTEFYSNGDQYTGELLDGKRNGIGTYITIDGTKYIGGYKDGEFHGIGTLYELNGKQTSFIFEKGKLVSNAGNENTQILAKQIEDAKRQREAQALANMGAMIGGYGVSSAKPSSNKRIDTAPTWPKYSFTRNVKYNQNCPIISGTYKVKEETIRTNKICYYR